VKKLPLPVLIASLILVSCSPATEPKGYAIVFGIEDYPPPNNTVKLTIDDAQAIASTLTTQGWDVQLFLDAQATKATLAATLKNLAHSGSPVLFYYSGHGTYGDYGSGVKFYICTYGPFTGYSMVTPEELDAMFAGNGILHGIAILDSCNSGGFVAPDGTAGGIPADYQEGTLVSLSELVNPAIDAYAGYAQSNNIVVLSAAGAQELSWESSSFGHGIFTYYLLESARYGDYDKDGFVSTVEAYAYASKSLEANWNQSHETSYQYLPRFSGEPRDYLLFKTVK